CARISSTYVGNSLDVW
nr:immunoglobulin heavy chain junction region [Macaca mulatta]MOV49963.1 immunoglobulin heavy chain junction region [Macaca mulatta]MOV50019.1 immunoglobulin heavy chain junction region [Macaca mulatta]MOV50389.1 immunoglobulin heavy chain junction region [Macaca mulatta]MOV50642.1 immunoglobulin heavy chain junction region [Macaca mulatta]